MIGAPRLPLGLALALFVGCGDHLEGLGGTVTPLASFQVTATGDLTSLLPPGDDAGRSLQVALVWGDQWLTEAFCILPPETEAAAAVIAAGCRDPFAFVPARVAASAPLTLGSSTTISLFDLPGADVLVGSLTARVAYGSFVLYDDRDGDGTLGLSLSHRTPSGPLGGAPPQVNIMDSPDIVYGASFVAMTAPDQRAAYREGGFDATAAFYPRNGCEVPPPGFSVLAAGGFSVEDGLASAATGQLPGQDPSTCAASAPTAALVVIGARPPAEVEQVSCAERRTDSSVRYREPPVDAPDLTNRLTACVHLPSFEAGDEPDLIQLVVSGRPQDRCKGLTHYTLRGCFEDVACAVPEWDFTTNPPAWWPCSR